MSSVLGLHSGAYAVGKNELLAWLNDTLQLGYTKIEQVSNGAAWCQLCDALFPRCVPMSRVNFGAVYDYESVKNYKILQKCFDKNGIDKHVDVEKLIQGKPMDNLEFAQWFKWFWDENYSGDEYDSVARRKNAKKGPKRGGASRGPRVRNADANTSTARTPAGSTAKRTPAGRAVRSSGYGASATRPAREAAGGGDGQSKKQVAKMEAEVTGLQTQLAEMRLIVDSLEKERDFYFSKLREIEILCQDNEDKEIPFLGEVEAILYAADDAAADEDGEAVYDADENATPTDAVEAVAPVAVDAQVARPTIPSSSS